MNIVLRKQAKENNLRHYYTGLPCKFGHIDKRSTCDGRCMECARITTRNRSKFLDDNLKKVYNQTYRDRHPNKNKEWHAANRDHHHELGKRWRESHPGYQAKSSKEWRNRNPEWTPRYNHENRHKHKERHAKRRAAKLNAVPKWITKTDLKKIAVLYESSQQKTKQTHIQYSVDHEIPLQGEIVCGLHVLNNLQIITLSENVVKGNKFDQDAISQKYYEWLKENLL